VGALFEPTFFSGLDAGAPKEGDHKGRPYGISI
jgi:hypothetical protein